MIITHGPTGLKDFEGKEISVGDQAYMWRPFNIERVVILKYNTDTDMVGVELLRDVGKGVWLRRQKFSTPYDNGKFVVTEQVNIP